MTGEKPTVLIIEDDPFMTSLLAEEFTRAGFDTAFATNADDAVRRFSEIRPQALLVDVVLPGRSGLAALAEIRKLSGGEDVPAVILSNIDEAAYLRQAERLKAAAYLVKANVETAEVVAKVKEALGTAKR